MTSWLEPLWRSIGLYTVGDHRPSANRYTRTRRSAGNAQKQQLPCRPRRAHPSHSAWSPRPGDVPPSERQPVDEYLPQSGYFLASGCRQPSEKLPHPACPQPRAHRRQLPVGRRPTRYEQPYVTTESFEQFEDETSCDSTESLTYSPPQPPFRPSTHRSSSMAVGPPTHPRPSIPHEQPPPAAPTVPTARRNKSKTRRSRSTAGWIWPKDPKPGNPIRWSRWDRFSDVIKGKGPDIYVGRIYPRTQQDYDLGEIRRYGWEAEPCWTLWGREHLDTCDAEHCDDCTKYRQQERRDERIKGLARAMEERYDFRMRKYRVPDEGTWSSVRYCGIRGHTVPRAYRDMVGQWYPADYWHDVVHYPHPG
ncbi:uncharacterized protein BJX67DRAFT_120069 [Aspergillus lucknowensis]|uniref:Uncharacterized protein n=1 Tax=Aspergillus lucknowensis TaxID=176173 RepID=A0ABR4LQT2_9EURO